MSWKERIQSKTFWAGITAIVGGIGGAVTKSMTPAEYIPAIWGGLALIFVRDAIQKSGPEAGK